MGIVARLFCCLILISLSACDGHRAAVETNAVKEPEWSRPAPQPPDNSPAESRPHKPTIRLDQAHSVTEDVYWYQDPDQPERLMATSDHGRTWRDITPPQLKNDEHRVGLAPYYLDAQHAWVIALAPDRSITAYLTRDGGIHWDAGHTAEIGNYGDGGMQVQFATPSDGFIQIKTAGMCVYPALLMRTRDSGMTWEQLSLPSEGSIHFRDASHGWLSGSWPGCDQGRTEVPFFQTTDGGETWTEVDLSKPEGEKDTTGLASGEPVFFHGGIAVMSVYVEDDNHTIVYRSEDDGKHWELMGVTDGSYPVFTDPDHGTITSTEDGRTVTESTSDGGRHWDNP